MSSAEVTKIVINNDVTIYGSTPVFGPEGAAATFVGTFGFQEQPAPNGSVETNQFRPGATATRFQIGPRAIPLNGNILANSRQAAEWMRERLISACKVNEPVILAYHHLGRVFHTMIHNTNAQMATVWGKGIGDGQHGEFSLLYNALDPRILSGDGNAPTKVIDLPIGVGNEIDIVNAGKGLTPPLTIELSNCSGPQVFFGNDEDRHYMRFPDLNLYGDDKLVLDFDKKTVLLNGENARKKMVGRWPQLAADRITVGFAAQGGNPEAVAKTYDSYLTA